MYTFRCMVHVRQPCSHTFVSSKEDEMGPKLPSPTIVPVYPGHIAQGAE